MNGPWKDAVVANGGTLSGEVDLGKDYRKLEVIIPTITSATVAVQVAETSGDTAVQQDILDDDATGHFAQATTAGTGGIAMLFDIGGCQYIKIVCGAAQGAARTFRVRGVGEC